MKNTIPILFCSLFALSGTASASQAYGTLNNFDVVNETEHECHGFEIELEDLDSLDISYTYNYNHYGTSHISVDNSDPTHPLCRVRWESAKNPDGSWAAYTAIPSGPIAPSNGHQFTNPNVNFGGEHFGVGYRKAPTAVRYHWLLDDGAGNLVAGPPVQVSTPTWNVSAGGGVGAVIAAPAPPEIHPQEFGPAVWVKEICTTSHNDHKVALRDLVSDDPDDDDDINWRNGEPDEVEIEWHLLQIEFADVEGGANGEFEGAPAELEESDDVVTRRFEFFEYTGPVDLENGEAKADNVAEDETHGVGIHTINDIEVDLSTVVVVGNYLGAQMAAFDIEGKLTLIEQLQDGEVGNDYPNRLVIIPGQSEFTATLSGNLPDGLVFNLESGVLSGTPTTAGEFTFTIEAIDALDELVVKTYTIVVAAAGQELPPHAVIDTGSQPVRSGSTSGDGAYDIGEVAELVATPDPGFEFVRWEEQGQVVSEEPIYALPVDINHSVLAVFAPVNHVVATNSNSDLAGSTSGGGEFSDGVEVTLTATANIGYQFVNWTENGSEVSNSASYTFNAASDRGITANFTTIGGQLQMLTISPPPANHGSVVGTGTYIDGSNVTIVAAPAPGYTFVRWTNNGAELSSNATHSFPINTATNLSAVFEIVIPKLTLTPAADGLLQLDWLSALTDWTLEECTDLSTDSWSTSPLLEQVNGEHHQAEVAPTGRRFYRLTHPTE